MLNGLNSATNHEEELSENVNDRGHSIWNSETGLPPTVHGHTHSHTQTPSTLTIPGTCQGDPAELKAHVVPPLEPSR